MAPHALPPSPPSYGSNDSFLESPPELLGGADSRIGRPTSLLQSNRNDEIQDVICVGFGPASLAIAVALHDVLEAGGNSLGTKRPKIRFLEKQPAFAWHAGMLLPGTKMQITFVKDLATLRNPRSKFTFLNYLHSHGRLASFTNLGTFLPQRIEFEDYMRWCARHFDDVVEYSQEIESVEAGKTNPDTGKVEYFQVRSKDPETGDICVRRARHVVLALGGKPSIPKCLQSNHPKVIHSSQYATSISTLFPSGTSPRSVAIIGGGQSAAEIFHNLPSRFPGSRSYLVIRGSALRPSDDSPFVNEIFDPERVDDVFSQDEATRAAGIRADKATNYGVVRLELLEEIYSAQYLYRIKYKSEEEWPQRILTHRTILGMKEQVSTDRSTIQLQIQDESGSFHAHKKSKFEILDVDLVIVASGYRRDAHEGLMESLRPLTSSEHKRFTVGRDYGVNFKPGLISPDAGVWLQGCNEGTHGLSDSLLSILAVRGGEMVQNIFGSTH